NITYLVPEGSECNFAKVLEYNPEVNINKQIPENIDIVHMHFETKEKIDKPHVITMHGNATKNASLSQNTIFISKNHAERHGSNCFVYNGLNWGDYNNLKIGEKRKYFHYLGRADWKVKNMHGACKIADKANEKLVVMGGNRWNYTILKRIFTYMLSTKIEFKGMVDNITKMQVMNNSKGLIFPVRWHEPFGLAVIESLYAGCPVFATPFGSLKELVPPEVGILSNSSTE